MRHGFAIEAHQAIERAQPEITVMSRCEGDNRALRQAVFGAPNVHDERHIRRRAVSQNQR